MNKNVTLARKGGQRNTDEKRKWEEPWLVGEWRTVGL